MAKRRRANPGSGTEKRVGLALLIAAVIYFGWCGYVYYQTGEWSWAPWKQLTTGFQELEQGTQ